MKNPSIRLLAALLTLFLLAVPASAEPTPSILSLLNDDRITQTYTHLQSGNTITQGDKSQNLRGLQVLLNMLGSDLTVDGSVGEKTFAQLARVQSALSLPKSETVTLSDYEPLMLYAYILSDPVIAGGVLGSQYTRQIAYAQAAQHYMNGEYYTARQLFIQASGFEDSDIRANDCVRPWPENGPVVRDSSYSAEDCHLIVKVSQNDREATYIKVYSGQVLVAGLFVAGSGEATINLPKGTYTCKSGNGTDWYGPKDAFGLGDDAKYQRLTFDGGQEKFTMRAGYQYTLTIGSTEQSNVGTKPEDPGSF